MYRRAALLLGAVCALAAAGNTPARASQALTVVTADHLSYRMVAGLLVPDNLQNRWLAPDDLQSRACIALLSPGLPNPRHGTPTDNLYASLSAGDMIDRRNEHAGLLQRQLAASGVGLPDGVHFVYFGDASAPGRMNALRLLLASSQGSLLLVGVTPVEGRDQGGHTYWNDLTPLVWLNPPAKVYSSATLTSATTQTAGLIALRDVAPTILQYERLPIPPSMSGHAAQPVIFTTTEARDSLLARMDTLSRTNAEAQHPFGWIYGLGGGAILLAAIACALLPSRLGQLAPSMRYLTRFLLAVPLAQLIVPWLVLGNATAYLLEMTGTALLLAWVAGLISPRSPLTPVLWATAGALVLDAFAGTPLISRALLAGYWLSGIRFYGIGNEFMGLLLGAALLAPVVLSERANSTWTASRFGRLALAAWFAVVLVALAYPQFGAKAGGAVTASATFLPAWWAIARGREVSWRVWLVSVAAGFALIFAFSTLAHALGGRATHIQDAAAAMSHGRLGYIAAVALRKAKMAVHIALAPGTLTGIGGFALVAVLWLRSDLRTRVNQFLSGRDNLRRALVAGLWGMLASILFNDSGAAAMLLMGGVLALSLLHEMLTEQLICAYSPSMSATSGSASPSPTSLSSAHTL